jgi:hypothetical protein
VALISLAKSSKTERALSRLLEELLSLLPAPAWPLPALSLSPLLEPPSILAFALSNPVLIDWKAFRARSSAAAPALVDACCCPSFSCCCCCPGCCPCACAALLLAASSGFCREGGAGEGPSNGRLAAGGGVMGALGRRDGRDLHLRTDWGVAQADADVASDLRKGFRGAQREEGSLA